jgi:hypothetical protein
MTRERDMVSPRSFPSTVWAGRYQIPAGPDNSCDSIVLELDSGICRSE